jgi:hypothetical protein
MAAVDTVQVKWERKMSESGTVPTSNISTQRRERSCVYENNEERDQDQAHRHRKPTSVHATDCKSFSRLLTFAHGCVVVSFLSCWGGSRSRRMFRIESDVGMTFLILCVYSMALLKEALVETVPPYAYGSVRGPF